MFSYFSDPDNVEHFSIGFDLAGKHLPESVIIQIIAEIEGVQEDYPDDRNAVIALDALYDILGERSGAISALAHYTVVFESSIAMLRTARQLTLQGRVEEAEDLLSKIVQLKSEGSMLGELCTLLAFARLNDREAFATTWHRLVERYCLPEPVAEEEFFMPPDEYTLLHNLPFREQIEGLEYLFQYEIQEFRDAEVFALIDDLRSYLEFFLYRIPAQVLEYDTAGCLLALQVVKAISDGSREVAEKILSMHGPISDEERIAAINENVESIRQSGVSAVVMSGMLQWISDPVQPAEEMLDALRKQTGGDDRSILEAFHIMSSELPEETLKMLLLALLETYPDDRRIVESIYEMLESEERYDEALALAERYEFLRQDGESFDQLKLNALSSSDEEAAFRFLFGRMKEGCMLEHYADLFDLALELDRMDEVSQLRSIFAAERIAAGTHLLNALERLEKKDIKGALALIERAREAGLRGDLALMISAHTLLSAGYPKRVVGLCKAMLKRSMPPEEVYPLLVQAYRDLGKESEARAAEAALAALLLEHAE